VNQEVAQGIAVKGIVVAVKIVQAQGRKNALNGEVARTSDVCSGPQKLDSRLSY
jgi:hypothetical protein